MNPLSPFTYYRRHPRRAFLLAALLAAATAGLYLVIGLLDETFINANYRINNYLEKFSLVEPAPLEALDPTVAERIQANPDVAHAWPELSLSVLLQSVGGEYFPLRLMGLRGEAMEEVLRQSGDTLADGRLPEPGANEVALSGEIAAAFDLRIGDTFDRSLDETAFAGVPSPLQVTGILSGEVRLGILSYEFVTDDADSRALAREGILLAARPGREDLVETFLRDSIRDSHTTISTNRLFREKITGDSSAIFVVGIPMVLLVTAAVTLVIGAINRLALLRRLPEFGVLVAVGRGKGWLARRLTLETAVLALAGWALGLLLGYAAMAALSAGVYAPEGFGFNPLQSTPLLFVLPLPLAVIGFTLFSAVRALQKLDPVAIVERGELSMEGEQPGRAGIGGAGSLPRPLAPATYYRRHARQAAVLIGAMALMIVGTAIFVFVIEMFDYARQPLLNHLDRMSLVSPDVQPLEASAADEIRAHPGVDRAISAYVFSPLGISMPPVAPNYPGEAYAVSAENMDYLVNLFGLKLEEGHLPRPGSNEIAIPWTFARNRDLHLGDAVGDADHPVFPDAPALPGTLTVAGIFTPVQTNAEENWLSFASLEFIDQNRAAWKGGLSLIVTAQAGEKAALDSWLEREMDGESRTVFTEGNQRALFREQAAGIVLVLSILEAIIALVAALTLAGLNYIFINQREAEFGVLNALGFSRLRLVGRVLRETLYTTGAAWLAAVLVCFLLLLAFQGLVYEPAGLHQDFFNPLPWLYTLPVPLAVLVVNAGSIARMLSRLDAVGIIERR